MKRDPGQPSLLREHDLPPRWDGRLVTWRGWEPELPAFICPAPRVPSCCTACGSIAKPVNNRGLVALSPNTPAEQLDDDRENRRRLGPLAHKRKPLALWRLHVWRCVDCRHDVVLDIETDEWWDLDDLDYTEAGSDQPVT